MRYDDEPEDSLAKLRTVSLKCPDCPQVIVGLSEDHAAELLAIHTEGTCQGRQEVNGDDDGDPAPADPPADALRVMPAN